MMMPATKAAGAGVGDFVLGLIAHPATQLNVLEDGWPSSGVRISTLGEMIFTGVPPYTYH